MAYVPTTPAHAESASRRTTAAMVLIAALALLVRGIAYTGFFGSDEVTYVESAARLLSGDWRVESYVGANRLGINLPIAAALGLFGRQEWAAALFPLLCSVLEVVLVCWAGTRMFGLRVGIFAGVLMATLPSHVHFAGRIMADAPLALAITASFVCFHAAERSRRQLLHLMAGVCLGATFWIKPHVLFIYAVLLAYPLLVRRIDVRWAWVVAGALLAIGANSLTFGMLTGNPLYMFDAVRSRHASGYLQEGASVGEIVDDPLFYFRYLFVQIYHTGLVGYLAAVGLVAMVARRAVSATAHGRDAGRFLLLWAGGLIGILSFLPVSFHPVIFVPKQTNYMLIFAAPLCLLGGLALTLMPTAWSWVGALAAAAIGVLLALLLQATVAVFTANSWETLRYLSRQRADQQLHVMSNAYRAAQFEAFLGKRDLRDRLASASSAARSAGAEDRWVVIDEESFQWDGAKPFAGPLAVPKCWVLTDELRGAAEGPGPRLAAALSEGAGAIPAVGPALAPRLARLARPLPARVYRIPAGC